MPGLEDVAARVPGVDGAARHGFRRRWLVVGPFRRRWLAAAERALR